jgi:hypothetical protein
MKASTPVQAGMPRSEGLVISRVVQRRDVIIVRAGSNGPTYSLESRNGAILVGEMTLGQLAANNPKMLLAIRTMEANTQWAGE